jgi:nucleoside recognition membrane protein YjiH
MKKAALKFIFFTLIAGIFFLFPLPFQGKWTVPFDIFITVLKQSSPKGVQVYTIFILFFGFILTLGYRLTGKQLLNMFNGSSVSLLFKFTGALLGIIYFLHPQLQFHGIPKLIFEILAVSVALIIPLGSIFVQLFIYYGGLEFIGTLFSPLMTRLFHLPGYAALDALTSWVGSYSVGLYLTRRVYQKNLYTRKHVAIIATCFSTVSIGFAGVIASTLNIFQYFPFIIISYFIAVIYLTFILVRIPPLSKFPEKDKDGNSVNLTHPPFHPVKLIKEAFQNAMEKAGNAPSLGTILTEGFRDGLILAMNITGSIVVVGTIALFLAKSTPLFEYLGYPFIVLLKIFGLPSSPVVGAAVISEISEMYIPTLLVVHLSLETKLFIAILSLSQLIFFSSLGPMILEMFKDIPIRFHHLISLFFLRTLLLLPFCAVALYLFHFIY